jgi:branched-chain amino acid transport system substrate-binding protein
MRWPLLRHKLLVACAMLSAMVFVAFGIVACGDDEGETTTTAAGTTTTAAAGEIKIGFLGLLSGAGALAGRPIQDGAKLAVEEINAAGGVLGQRLVLISRDTGGSPEEAVRLARELIQSEGAQFIQGPFTDAENMAVSAVSEELKTIMLPYVAKTDRLLSPEFFHPYVFQPSSSTLYEGGYAAEKAAELTDAKTVVAIAPDYEYGHMQTASFVNRLAELRPDMTVQEIYAPLFAPDFTPYVTQIVDAAPDVLYIVQWGSDYVTVLKQLVAFDAFSTIDFTVTVGENGSVETALALGADYPEGILANAMDVLYWPNTPEHEAYEAALAAFTGEPYTQGNTIQGYIGIKLLAAAIELAGTTETDAVVAALEGLTIDTPLGPMLMGEDHQLRRAMVWGYTKLGDEYPFAVLDQPELVGYDDVVGG